MRKGHKQGFAVVASQGQTTKLLLYAHGCDKMAESSTRSSSGAIPQQQQTVVRW